jgi:YVTN family beta-propeller protein
MYNNSSNRNRAACTRDFAAFLAALVTGLGLMASRAEAAPFLYVANGSNPGTVSVIDTATNMVVATVAVGSNPIGIAVTPDRKHVYVTNQTFNGSVSVIDTAANTVVATVPVASNAFGVAVTPDGKHAYVTNLAANNVSVIDTATNMVVATVPVAGNAAAVAAAPDGKHVYVTTPFSNGSVFNRVSVIRTASNTVVATIQVGNLPVGVAFTPNGTQAYVANGESNNVSVIDTATNTVVATIRPGGNFDPSGVAVTPDGKHAYVASHPTGSGGSSTVSVIDTATNTVVATVPVGLNSQGGVAFTPDGKLAYVTNAGSIDVIGTVSVIDTVTNTVMATVTAGSASVGVGIIPPPPGVPFLAFSAKLAIQFGSIPTKDAFGFGSNFILSSTAPGINPVSEPVTLQLGTFTTTIPPGSFKKQKDGSFTFQGKIHGVGLGALIKRTGTLRYLFEAKGLGANLTGTVNTVYVTLAIGGGSFSNSNSGATSVTAEISH